jgi:hypothetical protein
MGKGAGSAGNTEKPAFTLIRSTGNSGSYVENVGKRRRNMEIIDGNYIVNITKEPLYIEIFHNKFLVSVTSKASDGLLITVNHEFTDHNKISSLLKKSLQAIKT